MEKRHEVKKASRQKEKPRKIKAQMLRHLVIKHGHEEKKEKTLVR
jgi:hypothetical protein